ncbi:MAG: His/Gly/Thr/Pro-type tRNA ligase C-terminal domain-containing protein, partial [Candidatus Nitrosotenuis sp.]
PPRVAPIQIVIVPIYYSDKDAQRVNQKADEVERLLVSKGLRVHVDRRDELTPGFKYNEWELRGVPLRIEIGPKDLDKQKVTVARRHNRQKSDLPFDKIGSEIGTILQQIQDEMFTTAKKMLDDRTVTLTDYSRFKPELEKGHFIKASWCGDATCEEKIKEETMADIRVIPFGSENSIGKCIYCGQQGSADVIFGRAY